MLRAIICAFTLSTFQAIADEAQIRVAVLAGEHRPHQYMTAVIRNRGTQPVTICLEQDEMHREDRRPQPWPFYVERFQSGTWTGVPTRRKTSGRTEVIEPGANLGFSFSVSEEGQYRLTLQYWPGDNRNGNCADLGARGQVKSKTFQVTD